MSKIIVMKADNNVAHGFEDSVTLAAGTTYTQVGAPFSGNFHDVNSENSDIHEDVTLPEDFMAGRYKYDGSEFTLNPDWQNPVTSMLVSDKRRYEVSPLISETFLEAYQTEIDRFNAL